MADVHVSLGHLLFQRQTDDKERREENICFMSRNLFSDKGPIMNNNVTAVEQNDHENDPLLEEEEEKEEEVLLWQQAKKKYQLFRSMNEDLLDPNMEEEFEIMRQMGLPTMLVNNYDDMEQDNDENNDCVRIVKKKSQHTKSKKIINQITDGINDEITDGITDGINDEITGEIADEITGEIADEIPEKKTGEITEQNTGEIIEEITEESNPLLMDYRIDDNDSNSEDSSRPSSPFSPTVPVAALFDEFEVNWDEVKEGKAAGLPSQWEQVQVFQQEEEKEEDDIEKQDQEDQSLKGDVIELYDALRVKAKAYADKEWLNYWERNGPSYLAECWKIQYPFIPLKHVEIVSGINCLCDTLQKQMHLYNNTNNAVITNINNNNEEEEEEQKEDTSNIPSDREILNLWNEFYNNTYWYTYDIFESGKEELKEKKEEAIVYVEEEQQQTVQEEEEEKKESEDTTAETSEETKENICTAITTSSQEETAEQQSNDTQMNSTVVNKFSHSSTEQITRTIYFIKSLGFTIGNNVGTNPHKRTFSRVICKLLQKQQKEDMIVNNEGQLVMKRQKKPICKRKKSKKKKSKKSHSSSMTIPINDTPINDDMPISDNIIDDSTGQTAHTDSHTTRMDFQTDSHTTSNSYTIGTDSHTTQTNFQITQTDSHTAQTDSNTTQTETHADASVTVHSTAESESDIAVTDSEGEGEDDTVVDVKDCNTECIAGNNIIYSNYLPSRYDMSSCDHKLAKYWSQRYRLFSLYDEDIRMDDEGWFSASPEKIAIHIAERCQCDLIVDAFCGVGSNAIQFAFTCERVIAIDIDPVKIACARHNAEIYGVADRIDFILGDYYDIMPYLTCADVVFISPPWGGPQYLNTGIYDLKTMVSLNGVKVFEVANEVTSHIAYYLPRNIGIDQLVSMVSPGFPVEVEQQFMNRKLKTITAYYGELVNP